MKAFRTMFSRVQGRPQWLLQGITKEIFGPKKTSLKGKAAVKLGRKLRHLLFLSELKMDSASRFR